ncbi:Pcc1-domain-containing protein [Gonapodya prolifera JEL478]|uniref:Pcc1-domain-containing protein n=1 Tax=Gonapodya prolifera (strain JEL478) TaxID=1344416 RepID=A0A139AE00_GONPJ|nr:Pcc1-domain-containing protein [Gonapodya prolifera JEL478]|eukprot:KXS14997.1 Pcc1-domain-containing protein [Gonapodya prolifera JEL478]
MPDELPPYQLSLSIPYPTPRHAEIVRRVLSVDKEHSQDMIKRRLRSEGNVLVAEFDAWDVKKLRTTVGFFTELAALATETIVEFDGEGERGADGTGDVAMKE